jgi:hypothetical protein
MVGENSIFRAYDNRDRRSAYANGELVGMSSSRPRSNRLSLIKRYFAVVAAAAGAGMVVVPRSFQFSNALKIMLNSP